MSRHYLLFLKKLRHMVIIYHNVGVRGCVGACVHACVSACVCLFVGVQVVDDQ